MDVIMGGARAAAADPAGQRPQAEGPVVEGPTVESLDAAVYVVPTDAPEADGTLAWDKTTLVLVTARAGGQQGIGWSYTAAAAAPVVTGILSDVVAGWNALDVAGANEAMTRALRNVGRPGLGAMALSAADIALWDLKARLLGCPVAGLIGRARDDVPVYGSGGFTTYDDARTREQLSGWVGQDRISRVKIKIGESWGSNESRDLARVALAREVIGPDTELYVDANGGYSTGQAVRMADRMDQFGVTWFEEPVSSQDLRGLATVRRQVRPDVTAGEYSWTLADSARLLAAEAVDCLQLDVTRCGGITEFLRGAALAAAHNVQVSGHCAPNLHARVAVAVPGLRHLEYFHDHQRIERMLFDGTLDPAGGVLTPDPGRPGLGLELRSADAERYRAG
ncbi:MAG TPA: enolase C-terminal domain-like protein [Streptosporangiaceae bacterium]|jgi:L-alanine-DL-glutamate epimerase-like enolase superfamily enzyme|nr:enolase C-terminal domain-like protein [Streptosporangiaceae bacterium]